MAALASSTMNDSSQNEQYFSSTQLHFIDSTISNSAFSSTHSSSETKQPTSAAPALAVTAPTPTTSVQEQPHQQPQNALPTDWSADPWSWSTPDISADAFSNFDVDYTGVDLNGGGDFNWYNWVESANAMEWDTGSGNNGWP